MKHCIELMKLILWLGSPSWKHNIIFLPLFCDGNERWSCNIYKHLQLIPNWLQHKGTIFQKPCNIALSPAKKNTHPLNIISKTYLSLPLDFFHQKPWNIALTPAGKNTNPHSIYSRFICPCTFFWCMNRATFISSFSNVNETFLSSFVKTSLKY